MKKRFNTMIVLLSIITLMMGTLIVIIPIKSLNTVKGTMVKGISNQKSYIPNQGDQGVIISILGETKNGSKVWNAMVRFDNDPDSSQITRKILQTSPKVGDRVKQCNDQEFVIIIQMDENEKD
jgi:hypothetical protein